MWLVCCLLALSCSRDASNPPNTSAPHPRLVSLAPALTSIVTALGAADHLVGVTSWCDAPGVTVVGDMKPRPEAVLLAKPDLVVMARYGSQAPDLAPIASLGLETLSLPLVTLADMRAATVRLGEVLGRDGAALVSRFDEALAKDAGPPVKVLVVYGLEPGFVITTGGGDHVSELIAALGGVNVVSGPVTTRLGLERVLMLDPEVILHASPSTGMKDSAAALSWWSHLPTLSAVKNRRVHVFPRDGLGRNSPRLLEELPELARCLREPLPWRQD